MFVFVSMSHSIPYDIETISTMDSSLGYSSYYTTT